MGTNLNPLWEKFLVPSEGRASILMLSGTYSLESKYEEIVQAISKLSYCMKGSF